MNKLYRLIITVLVSALISATYTIVAYKWKDVMWKLRTMHRNITTKKEAVQDSEIVFNGIGGGGVDLSKWYIKDGVCRKI